MIPKSPRPDDFKGMIDNIRQQFSNTQSKTVGDIKNAFSKSSHEVVESVDQVRMSNRMDTQMVIDHMQKNVIAIQNNIGKYGVRRLVDINYDLADDSSKNIRLLKDIKDLQIGMSSRSGIFGRIRTWVKSFQPFTNERRQKMIARQRIAANKLLRLTYLAQVATKEVLLENLIKMSGKSNEEKQENRNFLLRLTDRLGLTSDPEKFGKRDRKWLSPKSFMDKLLDFMKFGIFGILTLSSSAIAGIVLSYITRFTDFAKIGNKIGKLVGSSKFVSNIGAIFMEMIAKFGNFVDKKSPFLKKAIDILTKDILGKKSFLGKIFGFFTKVKGTIGPLLTRAGKAIPFFGKAFSTLGKQGGKFIPFVNVIIGAYEILRGMFKGMDKIGGLKGALVGIFGGIMEFFTLGIFDMDTFLETAKSALEKFQNGDILAGVLELIKAPFDGMKSGVMWLLEKLFGGVKNLIEPSEDAGLVGKTLAFFLKPWVMIFDAVSWLVEKLNSFLKKLSSATDGLFLFIFKIENFFKTIFDTIGDFINHPIETIRQILLGKKTPMQERLEREDKINKIADTMKGNNRKMNVDIATLMVDNKMSLEDAKKQFLQNEFEMARKRRMREIRQDQYLEALGIPKHSPKMQELITSPMSKELEMNQVYGPPKPPSGSARLGTDGPLILPSDVTYNQTEYTMTGQYWSWRR